MALETRKIHAAEFADFVRAVFWAAGRPVDDAFIEERARCTDLEGAWATFDDGQIVASLGTLELDLRMPSGVDLPVIVLRELGVVPGHTGRGYARAIVRSVLQSHRARGTVAAAWTTAEWPVNERWGSGPATCASSYEIMRRSARFREGFSVDGRCELITSEAARALLPALHRHSVAAGASLVARGQAYWSALIDRLMRGESMNYLKCGGGHPAPFFCLYRDAQGAPRGLAIYRIEHAEVRGLSKATLHLSHLIHATPAAYVGLWRFVLSVSLIDRVIAEHRPTEEPLAWMLTDGRQLQHTGTLDHVWLRILDVREALRLRGVTNPFEPFTLRVRDPFFEAVTVRVRANASALEVEEVEETDAAPDVLTDVTTLSAVFLGGMPVDPVMQASRVSFTSARAREAFISFCTVPGRAPFVDTSF